jgi:hypothetical protein
VADVLGIWREEADVDGLHISDAFAPGDFEDIVKWLFPELRERGVFGYMVEGFPTRETYPGNGNGPKVRDDHPKCKYTLRACKRPFSEQ